MEYTEANCNNNKNTKREISKNGQKWQHPACGINWLSKHAVDNWFNQENERTKL